MGNRLCKCGDVSVIEINVSYICNADVPYIKLLHKYGSFRCEYPFTDNICSDDIKEISKNLDIKLHRYDTSKYNQYHCYCCENCFKIRMDIPFNLIINGEYYEVLSLDDKTYVIDFIYNIRGFFQK